MRYLTCLILLLSFFQVQTLSQDKFKIEELTNPLFISVNEQGLFITEENSLAIFSSSPYRFEKRIGDQVSGDIAFKYPPMHKLYQDYIFLNAFTKCVWLDPQEEVIRKKEYSDFEDFNSSSELLFIPVKDNYVRRIVDHKNAKQIIHLVDSGFHEIRKLSEICYDFAKMPDDVKNYKLLFHYSGVEVYDNKIYIGDSKRGIKIDVFNSDGSFLYSIDREVDEIATTSEFKNLALEEMKAQTGFYNYLSRQNVEFSFYDSFPAFRYFFIGGGKIYIFTYKTKKQNHEVLILDLEGNYIDTLFLPLTSLKALKFTGSYDLLTIYDDKLFELVQDTSTKYWELYITDIK